MECKGRSSCTGKKPKPASKKSAKKAAAAAAAAKMANIVTQSRDRALGTWKSPAVVRKEKKKDKERSELFARLQEAQDAAMQN